MQSLIDLVPEDQPPDRTSPTLGFECFEQSDQFRCSIDPDRFEEKRLSNVSEELAYKAERLKECLSVLVGGELKGRGHNRLDNFSNEFRREMAEHVELEEGSGEDEECAEREKQNVCVRKVREAAD